MLYNWQQPDWPNFTYSLEGVEDALYVFIEQTGYLNGVIKALPADTQVEAIIDRMVAEAIKTSEIEGELLSRQDVMSSIRNKLGLNSQPEVTKDKKSVGAGELMVMVRDSYAEPLSAGMLFDWHKTLMVGEINMTVGAWRSSEEPMQIISGAYGRWKVHFEAPPSSVVPQEMKRFINWFNTTEPGGIQEIRKAPVRAAIAHLYFETIHPFEDGNGRIGRAIAEKALSQTLGSPVMLSLSQAIEANRKAYYEALMTAQQSNQITGWMDYFVPLVTEAQQAAKETIDFTLRKAQFFDRFRHKLNERQFKVINRMMEAGPTGFEGGMSAANYGAITKAPKATATRDLQALVQMAALVVKGGGRSTRYYLRFAQTAFE